MLNYSNSIFQGALAVINHHLHQSTLGGHQLWHPQFELHIRALHLLIEVRSFFGVFPFLLARQIESVEDDYLVRQNLNPP